jgi:hypothetical protein
MKRSMMQRKGELSTLLRIAIANGKSGKSLDNGPQNLTKPLVSEAIGYLINSPLHNK